MDKWIGCNPKNHLEVDKWHERTSSLDPNLDPTGWEGKREKERERGRKKESLEGEAYLLSRFSSDWSIKSRRDKRKS